MLPMNEVGHSKPRAGRMTAVMRAVAQRSDGQKVLRIGLVRAGRVVEERVIKHRTAVTVGPGEDATFIITGGIPRTHRLFEVSGGVYSLNLLPEMSGKISLDDNIFTPADLLQTSRSVRLSPVSRGRIVLGDTTLIFQFVDKPITPAKPQLPLAVKAAVFDGIDWKLTMIVAFSFLAHFGFIGSMYSDWSDPIVSESYTVKGLIDLAPPAPPPPVEVAQSTNDVQTQSNPAPVDPNPTQKPRPTHTSPTPGAVDNSASLADRGERMRMSMMLSFGDNTPSVRQVFSPELPAMVLAHPDANMTPDTAITLHDGAPLAMNDKDRMDLSKLVQTRAQANDHANTPSPAKEPAPSFTMAVSPATETTHVPNIERVIAALRPQFRRCYEQGLQSNFGMAGDLTMRIKIRPNGEVESATAVSNNGLSPQVAQCIAKRAQTAQFEAPGATGSTVDVPVKFVKQ